MRFSLSRALRLVLACTLVLLLHGRAQAGPQDFVLHNSTGFTIHALYVSPSDTDDWEEDILGQDTLADGASCTIQFAPDTKHKLYDILVTDAKGNKIEWHSINLLKVSEVELDPDGVATCK